MNALFKQLIIALCALIACQTVPALELLALPGGQMAAVGDTVEVEIRHRRHNHIWLGGFFSVEFDAGLELIDYEYTDNSDPLYNAPPQKMTGLLARAGVGAFSGLGDDIVVLRLWFRVLREGTHKISPSASGTQNALWASAIDFGTFIVPTYRPAFITTPSADPRALITFDDLSVTRVPNQFGLALRATLPIVSSGMTELSILGFYFDDNGRDDFLIAEENCTQAPLAAGALCEAQIEFINRDSLGGAQRRASLVMNSNASSDEARKVRVTAEVSVRDIRISQNEFYDVPIGQPGRIYSLFLRNSGETTTTFDQFELSPEGGAVTFSIVRDECTGATLVPGGQCDFDLHIQATPKFDSPAVVNLLFKRDATDLWELIWLRAWPPVELKR